MKIFSLFLLSFVVSVPQLLAQSSDKIHGFAVKHGDVTNAPLFLSVTGGGRVLPFHDGEMLQVGRAYAMIAVPDRGFSFSNWTEINEFTTTEITYDGYGNPLPPIVTTVGSPEAYTQERLLRFTMQPVDLIFAAPGNIFTITQTTEWQANFVPRENSSRNKLRLMPNTALEHLTATTPSVLTKP